MLVEEHFSKIANDFGYCEDMTAGRLKALPDRWQCFDFGRDQFNERVGIHHPRIRTFFRKHRTNSIKKLKCEYFPIYVSLHELGMKEFEINLVDAFNDDSSISERHRSTVLDAWLPHCVRRAEEILISESSIRDFLLSCPQGPLAVMGPALEFRDKAWTKPWPP